MTSIILDLFHKAGFHCGAMDSVETSDKTSVVDVAMLHRYFSAQGRKGGSSKSETKRQAVLANLAKARARRWPKAKAKEAV